MADHKAELLALMSGGKGGMPGETADVPGGAEPDAPGGDAADQPLQDAAEDLIDSVKTGDVEGVKSALQAAFMFLESQSHDEGPPEAE